MCRATVVAAAGCSPCVRCRLGALGLDQSTERLRRVTHRLEPGPRLRLDVVAAQRFAMSRCTFCTIAAGVPARATMPYHEVTSNPGRPLSATVGTSGSCGLRLGPGDGERDQLAALHVENRRHAGEHHLHVAAEKIVHRGASPLYRTCVALMPASILRLAGQVRAAPVAGRGEVELVRIGLRVGDQLAKVLRRHRRMHDEHVRRCASSVTGIRSLCVSNASFGNSVRFTVGFPARASTSV